MRLLLAAVALGTAASCGLGDADVASSTSAFESANGQKLNGQKLNGQKLNGVLLTDVDLTGGTYSGVTSSAGAAITSVKLTATVFTGTLNKKSITSTAFVGAKFVGTTSAGTTVSLRVESMTKGTAPNTDLWFYNVSYDASGVWTPLCGLDSTSAAIAAVPVNGRWDLRQGVAGGGSYVSDSTAFTFACRNAAIGKCVEAGYKPWKSATGFMSLQAHLTACTRMLRADYCGNGTSWTVDGRLIDLYDGVGLQLDTDPTWTFEASWTSAGASCVSGDRYYDASQGFAPCLGSLFRFTCNSTPFSQTVLIKDRYAAFLYSP